MATNTASTGNWNTAGTWTDGVPTADDDVIVPTGVTVTIDVNAVCRSITLQGTATLTHGAYSLTIGDATAGAGNMALSFADDSTYTITAYNTSTIIFLSSSATQQTIDFDGQITGNVTFGSASVSGNYQLTGQWGTSSVNSSQVTTLTKGALDFNDQTCYFGQFNSSNSNTRSVDLGNSAIHTYKTYGQGWSCSSNSGLTIDEGNSTIYMHGANGSMGPGGSVYETYYAVVFDGETDTDGNGFANYCTLTNLTVTGGTDKINYFKLNSSGIKVTGTLTLNGNSAVNRLFVPSATLGTTLKINLNGTGTISASNVDFRDIMITDDGTNAKSPEVNLSAITGGSGNCGGNSGITFTTADEWYWYKSTAGSGTYNFSDYSGWYDDVNGTGNPMDSGRTILPQDTANFTAGSFTENTIIDFDLSRYPGIDASGVDADYTTGFHMNNIDMFIYGSLNLNSNITITNGGYAVYLIGRGGSYNLQGTSVPYLFIQTIGGTVTLVGNLSTSSTDRYFSLDYGTFNAATYNVTCGRFQSTNSNTRTLQMGSGTWTMRQSGTTQWHMGTITNLTNPTTVGGTSTLIIGSSSGTDTFTGGGLTYNNLSIATGSSDLTIQGSNTFNTLTINAPKTVKFTAGTDQTVTSFVATGTAGNIITLDSTSASEAKLSDTTGTNAVEYCVIGTTGKVTVEGGATWTYDANSTLTSGDGWTPAGGGATLGIMTTRRGWWGDLCLLFGLLTRLFI